MQSTASTFLQIQTRVLGTFKRTDKTTELKQAINDAHREMTAAIGWRKAEDQIYRTCVIGREEYPVPDLVLRINHPIRIIEPGASNNSASSYPLDFLTKDEYDEEEPNPNADPSLISKSKPWGYTFFKNSILLTGIPDKAYTLEINIGGEAEALVEDIDQTLFMPTWDETIAAGALTRLYLNLGHFQSADLHQRIYRWGFAGNEKNITGGLELLKKLNEVVSKGPVIVQPRDF